MKIVVTGGSGRLGQAVVAGLAAQGYDVLSLDRLPHPAGHRPAWTADLTAPGALFEACRDAAGLVHLAAFQAPGMTSDCETFNSNTAMTYNALHAAADCAVGSVVLASSTAAYGYIYGAPDALPDYLPVDEAHPSRPTDPYGLSKVVGERIADSVAADGALQITSLRFPGINFDPGFRPLKQRMGDPGARRSGFWAYIDVRDAAAACRLALEADLGAGHRVFNVAAPTTSMREPTGELVRRYFPGVTDLRPKPDACWSGIDSSLAERELRFHARFRWEDADDDPVGE
jgi:nucleoside-diphosphate-sugar epimerase